METFGGQWGRLRWYGLGVVVLALSLVVVMRWPTAATALPPAATPTVGTAPAYTLPDFLKGYAISVTNFQGGSVALLGQTTLVLGGGPHGLAMQPGAATCGC